MADRQTAATPAAQPSPGGQDSHVLVLQEMRARLTDAGSPARTAALDAAIAALAARQLVRQEPAFFVNRWEMEHGTAPGLVAMRTGKHLGIRDFFTVPLYAAPPAQAVDHQAALLAEEHAHCETIDQRDRCEEVADELADHIARITGVDIGEHSSANCPWQNAIDAAEEYKPAQAVDLGQSQSVLAEVAKERARQEAKWGQQNHVDWTPTSAATDLAGAWPAGVGDHFKFITDYKAKGAEGHHLGYFDILMEEVAEAHDEARDGNTKATRAELVQVAAVAVAWIECIDRRTAVADSQAVGNG